MPQYNVAKKRGKSKIKISDKREAAMNKIIDSYSEDLDMKMAVIQELIPLGLGEICKELQKEVVQLAGCGHARGYDNTRWGRQPGSVYLMDQKFPIIVPRVRNKTAKREVQLQSYQKVQSPFAGDGNTVLKLLHGISTHKYHESSTLAAEAMGLSASNLSKRFKQKTADTLKQLQERSLAESDIIAIFIDAKRYADDGLIVAMGVTMDGDKIVLGIEHIHSENALVIEQWARNLITRGLKFEQGILFIIDGSKGIARAIKNCFGKYAIIQRCQWHKRENVVSYLNDTQKALCRGRMKTAYAKTTYKEAKAELERLHTELVPVNEGAANSLLEGLEETLTLHRLGLSSEISKSLNTTNCIESLMSQLGQYTDKVDRWQNSNQILRWTAAGLMDIEPRLYKIRGHNYLKVLRLKMRQMIEPEKLDATKESAGEVSNVSQAVSV
jgi:transposase-like protein